MSPVEHVHLTLYFAGDTDPRHLNKVAESVRRAATALGPITLRPEALATLPRQGPARLLAIITDSPGNLIEL